MPKAGGGAVVPHIQREREGPRALILGAIGALAASPTNAANIAESLGLNADEIKAAREVAVRRRDARSYSEFLQELLGLLGQEPQEERKVEVRLSGRHFFLTADRIISRLGRRISNLVAFRMDRHSYYTPPDGFILKNKLLSSEISRLDPGIDSSSVGCSLSQENADHLNDVWNKQRLLDNPDHVLPDGHTPPFSMGGVRLNFRQLRFEYNFLTSEDGFSDMTITITDPKLWPAVRDFAREWEEASRKTKGSREATVTIVKDYPGARLH